MQIIGYFKEFYVQNKFIGCMPTNYNNDVIGYNGKKTEILSETIILDNKKKLKKGTEVSTIIYPLTK